MAIAHANLSTLVRTVQWLFAEIWFPHAHMCRETLNVCFETLLPRLEDNNSTEVAFSGTVQARRLRQSRDRGLT